MNFLFIQNLCLRLSLVTFLVQGLGPALFLKGVSASGDDHSGHGHHGHGHGASTTQTAESHSFEWAGIFDTSSDNFYVWTAQKVKPATGSSSVSYPESSMKMSNLTAPAATETALHNLETEGDHSLKLGPSNCTIVDAGTLTTLTPGSEDVCYDLHFKQNWWQSLFTIDTTGSNAIAIFTEHKPVEFLQLEEGQSLSSSSDNHYLKDDHGHNLMPLAELPEAVSHAAHDDDHSTDHDDHDHVEYGPPLIASFLVNLVTLAGVIFFIPIFKTRMTDERHADSVTSIISGFAAGALLASAFFLLLFESTHLIGMEYSGNGLVWRWGTTILAGLFLPSLLHVVIAIVLGEGKSESYNDRITTASGNENQVCQPSSDSNGLCAKGSEVKTEDVTITKSIDSANDATTVTTAADKLKISTVAESQSQSETSTQPFTAAQFRLIAGILFGDFLHNFCDGVFIGAAFKGCGTSFGWSVALGTITHEITQELSDFVILTNNAETQRGGWLRPLKALVLNFLSGFGVMIGCFLVLAIDHISDPLIGLLLAFGGGTYIHIGATECLPKIYKPRLSNCVRVTSAGMFVIGAAAIGIVLFAHEHCEKGGGHGESGTGGGHEGHGHL